MAPTKKTQKKKEERRKKNYTQITRKANFLN